MMKKMMKVMNVSPIMVPRSRLVHFILLITAYKGSLGRVNVTPTFCQHLKNRVIKNDVFLSFYDYCLMLMFVNFSGL